MITIFNFPLYSDISISFLELFGNPPPPFFTNYIDHFKIDLFCVALQYKISELCVLRLHFINIIIIVV